jgi:metal-responsive CopG/Arc/MetJ family transcriptional regulator
MENIKNDETLIAKVFEKLAVKGYNNRNELVEAILKYFEDNNVTKNIKGNIITKENITKHIYNIIRDINNKKNGWWNSYIVVEETKPVFKLVLR